MDVQRGRPGGRDGDRARDQLAAGPAGHADTHARLAGEAGVLIPVTTDAHSTGALSYAELGVAQARRAWLTKEQILNTRSWLDVQRRTKA